MATPVHMKFVFRGVFLDTPEEWSFSAKFSRDTPEAADTTVDDVSETGVDAALYGLLNNSSFATNVQVTDWRAYDIGPLGKMEGLPLIRLAEDMAAVPTGTGTIRYPTDQALCVTTNAVNRGPARFGRFYLPGISKALAADSRLSETDATGYLTLATNFLKSVSDAIDMPLTSSSEGLNISQVGPGGARQTIDHISVGRVLDRIERRRRSMVEEYVLSGHIDW